MTDINYTDITILLDRSGSMSSQVKDVIGGINSFMEEQSKLPGKLLYTLYQFDNQFELHVNAEPVANAPRLDTNRFQPRGGTALYDAVVRAIADTGARLSKLSEDERPARVLFLIFTDGEENSSVEATAALVKEQIEHQRDNYQWVFTFMGANQDAILAAKSIGIQSVHAMTYAVGEGADKSLHAYSASLSSVRASGLTGQSMCDSMQITDQMRLQQSDLLKKQMTPEEFLSAHLAVPSSLFHRVAVYLKNRELAVQMLEEQLKICHEGGEMLGNKLLETQRELSRVIRKGKK